MLAVSVDAGTQHDDLSGLMRVCSLDEADELAVTYHDHSGQVMIDGDEGSHDPAQPWEWRKPRYPEVELAYGPWEGTHRELSMVAFHCTKQQSLEYL